MVRREEAIRMQNAPLSGIREMVELAAKLQKEGKPVIHLEIGEPDFNTPQHIVEAAKKALDMGRVHYSPVKGFDTTLQAVCDDYKKRYGLDYGVENALITHGVTHGIYLAMLAFLDPGDEILVPDPGFPAYFTTTAIALAKPVSYVLDTKNEFQIAEGSLDHLITEKTKMILINSPSNPCGFMLNEDSLKEVARIAIAHDLIVISDEVYDQMTYGGKKCMSIAQLPGMKERTIILNGFAKYYAMTGWRIGFILCDEKLWDPMMRLSYYTISCPNTFVQDAAVAALQSDDGPSQEMVREYERRRDYLYAALNALPGCWCQNADGAFYFFLNVEGTGMDSHEFCIQAANEAYVVMTPGSAFGNAGEGFVRVTYANSMENLVAAVKRLETFLRNRVK